MFEHRFRRELPSVGNLPVVRPTSMVCSIRCSSRIRGPRRQWSRPRPIPTTFRLLASFSDIGARYIRLKRVNMGGATAVFNATVTTARG